MKMNQETASFLVLTYFYMNVVYVCIYIYIYICNKITENPFLNRTVC